MNVPFSNDMQNVWLNSVTPSTVTAGNNAMFAFFVRYLTQKAISVFKWTIPKTWDKAYFLYTLYYKGFVVVLPSDKFGIIPQHGEVSGLNVFYQPLYALVTNPLFGSEINGKRLLIGEDCEIVKLTPEYLGIGDLIAHYAEQLALCVQGAECNLVNSRLAYVFGAKDDKQARAFKKMFQNIITGDPAVFVDKTLYNEDGSPNWQQFANNLKQNYIVGDVLRDMKKIENEFNTLVGIQNTNTDKRERLTDDEVNANNTETMTVSDLWLENLHLSIDKVQALYPDIKISVERRYTADVPIPSDTVPGNPDNNSAL